VEPLAKPAIGAQPTGKQDAIALPRIGAAVSLHSEPQYPSTGTNGQGR